MSSDECGTRANKFDNELNLNNIKHQNDKMDKRQHRSSFIIERKSKITEIDYKKIS